MNPVTRPSAGEGKEEKPSQARAELTAEQAAKFVQDWLDFGTLLPATGSATNSPEPEAGETQAGHHRARRRRRPGELHESLPVRCHGNQ